MASKRSFRDFAMEREGKPEEAASKKHCTESSVILQAFQEFQLELDTRHDKYERIVKSSRDVTIQSKRVIFLLHRALEEKSRENVFKEAEEKFLSIKQLFRKIALELEHEDSYQFTRAYSFGLQEFVEAYTFYYFLKNGSLVSREGICDQVFRFEIEEGESKRQLELVVPPSDYILGIADLTGELMRLCINSVGKGNLQAPKDICKLLRNIHNAFVAFGNSERGLSKKLEVMAASLKKIENTCYTITIRGSEVPDKAMLAEMVVSGFNTAPMADNVV